MENLNLLFNKTYYEKLGATEKIFEDSVDEHNTKIFETTFNHGNDFIEKCGLVNQDFRLKTVYPGLLIGTGNPHGSGKCKADINVGFSFDYTSGQPYIPGSSVKGTLRSHFKYHADALAEILGIDKNKVKDIEKEIFDGNDVFFDAVVFDGESKYGLLLGEDYITPHGEGLKAPVPIHIIKVLPDVRFEFRFKLHDGLLRAEEKSDLFKTLLKLFGIGAKTNVGYGILEDCTDKIMPKKQLPAKPRYGNNGSSSHQKNSGYYKGGNQGKDNNHYGNYHKKGGNNTYGKSGNKKY